MEEMNISSDPIPHAVSFLTEGERPAKTARAKDVLLSAGCNCVFNRVLNCVLTGVLTGDILIYLFPAVNVKMK